MRGFDVIPTRAGVGVLLGTPAEADALVRLADGLDAGARQSDAALRVLVAYARHQPVREALGSWLRAQLSADRELLARCRWLAELCAVVPEDSEHCHAEGSSGPLHLVGVNESRAACGLARSQWQMVDAGAWRTEPERRCEQCALSARAKAAELEPDDSWPAQLSPERLLADAYRRIDIERTFSALPRNGAAEAATSRASLVLLNLCVGRIAGLLAGETAVRRRALADQPLEPAAWLALPGAPWRSWVASLLALADGPAERWSARRERAAEQLGELARDWWRSLSGTQTSSSPRRTCCIPVTEPWLGCCFCPWCGRLLPRVNLPTGGVHTHIDAFMLAAALNA